MEVIIQSLATVLCTMIAGWYALQEHKQRKLKELERQGEELHYAMEKAERELVKCMALNTMHPNAHLCDMQDAMIKLDEATEAYDAYKEKLKFELR